MSIAAIEALVVLAAKYEPEAISGIIQLFTKANVTVADVEAAFAVLKPYSAYNIPDVAPTTPLPSV